MYRGDRFKRDKKNIPAVVKTIEYDPKPVRFIALLAYADGEKRYIIAPQGLQDWTNRSERRRSGSGTGKRPDAEEHALGTNVHNIEMQAWSGAVSWYAVPVLPAEQQGRKIRDPQNAQRRIAESIDQLLRYRRCGEQQRSQPRKHG